MIPKTYILEWQNLVPWKTMAQIEQDLVISRALVEIFADDYLAANLAFRGGTALHKLYLQPQQRYSEDIDLVQITAEPFGNIINKLRNRLQFLGKPQLKQKLNNNTLIFQFDSEFPPIIKLKVKVETNCKEHFSVLGYQKLHFSVENKWFSGSCNLTTYLLEELLGTKLRALYQRSKGRDLFDLYTAISLTSNLNTEQIIQCYRKYMDFVVAQPPSQKQFLQNMEAKMQDSEFKGDIFGLIRQNQTYNPEVAYDFVKKVLIEKI